MSVRKCVFPLIFLGTTVLWGVDESQDEQYIRKLENKYRTEYNKCTGDNRDVNLSIILMWKKQMNHWIKSVEYPVLRNAYRDSTGDTTTNILPCMVYHWRRALEKQRKEKEAVRVRDSIRRENEIAESLMVARELKHNPLSPYDITGIPFGINRNAFIHLFKKYYSNEIVDAPDCILVNDFTWGKKQLPTTFYFDNNNNYHRYEIETMHFPADSLDTVVRRDALYIADLMAEKLAPPQTVYRVGLFDIKKDHSAPYREWSDSTHRMVIYLATQMYLYNAKTVVEYAGNVPDTLGQHE
ncbi:MAG: hypothetical protein GF401_20845 [Chitinivibrionales bacterium]|nr:hypothetical protein [Chitinivibrionales bacterium]